MLTANADLASRTYASETATIPRALGLAFVALDEGVVGEATLSAGPDLVGVLRAVAAAHTADGFEQGVHDEDAALLLAAMAPVLRAPGALDHAGVVRAAAMLFRDRLSVRDRTEVDANLRVLRAMKDARDGGSRSIDVFVEAHARSLADAIAVLGGTPDDAHVREVVGALTKMGDALVVTSTAFDLAIEVRAWAEQHGVPVRELRVPALVSLVADRAGAAADGDVVAEAVVALVVAGVQRGTATATVTVDGLRSTGPGIKRGRFELPVGRRLTEWRLHRRSGAARFAAFDTARGPCSVDGAASSGSRGCDPASCRASCATGCGRGAAADRRRLPRQAAGPRRCRTGAPAAHLTARLRKTTLVEYVADLLGFALVKVNGPALGSEATSLDPSVAPDAASAAEITRLNRPSPWARTRSATSTTSST